MLYRTFAILMVSTLLPDIAAAEVDFPKTRDLVGNGEYYVLDSFGDWTVDCQRDKRGEDFCEAAITLTDLDHAIELDFSILPFYNFDTALRADVNTVP